VTVHRGQITDLDEVPQNPTWTASSDERAQCGPGEHLLTGGIDSTNPGNREVAVLESFPFGDETTSGWIAQITSNSGGTATAEVVAVCLK
jgi:hypothetical protein